MEYIIKENVINEKTGELQTDQYGNVVVQSFVEGKELLTVTLVYPPKVEGARDKCFKQVEEIVKKQIEEVTQNKENLTQDEIISLYSKLETKS